jgi:hypothetical protein
MDISRPFRIRLKPTEAIIRLLESVTLGSNGARYKHLDTREKIKVLHNPLFLTLERGEKVLGNITFCRREKNWYIRYFAFQQGFQGNNKRNQKNQKEGLLKKELVTFFNNALNNNLPISPHLFYAYIDPKNVKSLWMSQTFGFQTIAQIATQTFSRVKTRKKEQVRRIDNIEQVKELVSLYFSKYQLYFSKHTFNKSPFYGYYDESGELIAFLKTQKAKWSIERLPGQTGGVLTQIIPFIPLVKKIIQPKNHVFTTVEALWVHPELENDAKVIVLETLFEGTLYEENTNSFIWWVDNNEPLYQEISSKVNWGLMHKINGVNNVDLVVLKKDDCHFDSEKPFYTTAFDFI